MSGPRTWLRSRFARWRAAAAPLIVFVLLWAPSVSEACSQCLATRTRANQLAFIWTTVFLSITPLLIVGGIAIWLRRKFRAADQEREPQPRDLSTAPLARPARSH